MAYFFNANEVANVAIEIEKKGREFYLQAAQKVASTQVRDVFMYLADEEAKHEKYFRSMLTRLGKVSMPAWATQDEYMQYLSALIDSHMLFNDLAQRYLAQAVDEQEVIRMAMSFEKDTMLFFIEMKELVPDSEKYAVQQCYEEERRHLRELSKISAQLNAEKS
jgi:rubrerythrin